MHNRSPQAMSDSTVIESSTSAYVVPTPVTTCDDDVTAEATKRVRKRKSGFDVEGNKYAFPWMTRSRWHLFSTVVHEFM
jgi:hypothetical protein